jgi:hypothetical protein
MKIEGMSQIKQFEDLAKFAKRFNAGWARRWVEEN